MECAPLEVFEKKTYLIGSAGAGPLVSSFQYNTTAVPTLTYVSQLVPPPKDIHNVERKVLTHVLHIPTGALDGHAFFSLANLNGPKLTSIRATMFASAYRAAVVTCTTWPRWAEILHRVCFLEDYATLHALGCDRVHPSHWMAPPIFMHLASMLSGGAGHPSADIALERCSAELALSHRVKRVPLQKLAYAHLFCAFMITLLMGLPLLGFPGCSLSAVIASAKFRLSNWRVPLKFSNHTLLLT